MVNSAICAIFTLCHCKNLAAGRWSDFPPEKFYSEIFPKTNAVSITFGLRYIHGQSLKELISDAKRSGPVFLGDSLLIFQIHYLQTISSLGVGIDSGPWGRVLDHFFGLMLRQFEQACLKKLKWNRKSLKILLKRRTEQLITMIVLGAKTIIIRTNIAI